MTKAWPYKGKYRDLVVSVQSARGVVSKSLGLRFAPVGRNAELVGEGRGKIWFVVKHIHFQVGGSTPRNYGSRDATRKKRAGRCGRVG